MNGIKAAFWIIGVLLCVVLPKTVFSEQYYEQVRRGLGYNYGPPDPNTSSSRIGDDFFDPDSSWVWWSIIQGSGQITIFCDASLQQNTLKAIASSSPSAFVVKFPSQGAINSKKRSFVLTIADSTPPDQFGFQVECKVKAKTGPSTYQWYTLRYVSENGTAAESSDVISFYLGAGYKDGNYHQINRSLEEDLRQFHPSYLVTLFDTLLVRGSVAINGFFIWERLTSIEGYANLTSVAQGGQIEFHVSTTRQDIDSSYHFEILRAGATLQSVYTSSTLQGHFRPVPDSAYKLGCGWPTDVTFSIPTNWASGIYLVKLIASDGNYNYIPFVVRTSSPGSSSKILFQVSDNTWQAYNMYGGASFYENKSLGRPTLSFNRPYLESYYYPGWQTDTVGNRNEHGAGQFFKWEYPLANWLESHGYTVEYCSNQDVDLIAPSNFLDKYNLFLSIGHDEYVSKLAKDNLINFRKSSNPLHPTAVNPHARNLAFLSGNTIFWRVRYPNSSGRQIYCFFGIDSVADYSYSDTTGSSNAGWRGQITALNRAYWPVTGMRLAVKSGMSSHWIFQNTGLSDGQKFGIGTGYPAGISGYEVDYRTPNEEHTFEIPDSVDYSNIKVLADSVFQDYVYYACSGPPPPDNVCALRCSTLVSLGAEAVYYEYPSTLSRSKVFSAGCIQWSWGLKDADSLTNKVTKNITDGLASTFRGHITQNMTWSGNIYLGGDVTIDSGVTVTINPGTKIYFFPNNDVERTGGNSNKTELIIKGTLTCLGSQTDSIILTSASTTPSNGNWGGVRFTYPGRGEFDFTRFSYADTAIAVWGDTATVVVYNSTFSHFNRAAVYSRSAKVRLGGIFPLPIPPDCGKNNFSMNTASSGAKAVIKNYPPGGALKAEGNWWSQAPPQSSWFVGNVDYNPYLLGYATPDSCGGNQPLGPPPPEERISVRPSVPISFELGQNYPNPFNPTTTIRYALPEPAEVELRIYNILGQVVRTLVDEHKEAGYYQADWDGKDRVGRSLSSGVYIYKIQAGDFVQTKKMSVVK